MRGFEAPGSSVGGVASAAAEMSEVPAGIFVAAEDGESLAAIVVADGEGVEAAGAEDLSHAASKRTIKPVKTIEVMCNG